MGKGSPPIDNSMQLQAAQAEQRKAEAEAADRRQQAQWAHDAEVTKQQATDAAAAQTQQETTAANKVTAQKATTQELIEQALGGARGSAQTALASRGLSSSEYMPLIESELGRVRSTIPSTADSVGSYFTPDLADTVLNREQENRRTTYGQSVDKFFNPQYAQSQFSDTADDPLIDTILGEASGTAQSAIDRAKARGQLDDSGYSAAMNRLNQATTTGRARAQTLGQTVIDKDRQALNDIGNQARTGASGYTLGSTFDPSGFESQAGEKASALKGTFEGDVRGAIGDASQFYDTGDIIGFGAKEQGAQNTASSPLADVLAKRESDRTARRGLGSTGTF